jgi:succinate dehydrogenase/fumarate reductase flavoprotein subunit
MLDIMYGEGTVRRDFVGKYTVFKRYGIDISKEPILIYPTLHYQNGGLEYTEDCESSLPGLYIAGEVGGGVHGENRLGGNSLMDVLVFGKIAGRNAVSYARERAKEGKLTLEHVRSYHRELREAGIEADRVSPMLIPDYSNPAVRKRQLTTRYVGTMR